MRRATFLALTGVCLSLLFGCGGPQQSATPPPQTPSATKPETVAAQGPNLVTNGDFSQRDAADNTLPAGWKRVQGSKQTVALAPMSSGSSELVAQISPDPKGRFWQEMGAELPLPEAPATYLVTFDGRTIGEGKGLVSVVLRKGKKDVQRLAAKLFSSPEFKTVSFPVQVPAKGAGTLEIWLGLGDYHNTKCVIQYDNVKVQQTQ